MTVSAPADVVIVGGGLAGGLLALELRDLGASVSLIDAPGPAGADSATGISYGALPGWPLAATPLARLAAGASKQWRRLQGRHGELGWRPCRLRVQAGGTGLGALSAWWPLPFAQVDTAVLVARLPLLLAAAGVRCRPARLERLERQSPQGWQLNLSDGSDLMLSFVRAKDGSFPLVYGTWVGANGVVRHIEADQITLTALGSWTSPHTGATWPSGWRVQIAQIGLDVTVTPELADQELNTLESTGVIYWEGANSVAGSLAGVPITGRSYVELTGYATLR